MSNASAVILGVLIVLLGALVTAFFTLLWRRLDSIDKILIVMQADLKQFYGDQKKLEGRVEEISHRVK